MSTTFLSVIIPVYNERESLPELTSRLRSFFSKFHKSYEVIFIDDGSTDESFTTLKNLISQDTQYKLIRLRKNFGQTTALTCGIDYAQGEILVPLDSDLENDPEDIPRLLEKIQEGYDIVSGWRKNRWKEKMLTRRMTSLAANWIISKVSGIGLHDFGCSLKAYRMEILRDIKIYGEMHRFIPALAAWQGARVAEIEVSYAPRKYGRSNYGLNRIFKVLLDLVTLKFLNDYSLKPIYFFGKIGFVSFCFGILVFIWATYYKLAGQKDYIQTPLPVIMVLFLVVGIILILIGLLAEMVMRMYHETGNRPRYFIKEKLHVDNKP